MKNIMIVEDEAITALDIQTNLERLGYSVKGITGRGEEAIKLADEVKPDLILMDIMLDGEMDGTMAAHSIASKHDIPIVFLTAYSDEKTFNAAKMPNTYSYLTKPYREKDLKNALELAAYKHKVTIELADAKKRYQAVMDNALVGIVVHDADGLIHEVNKQAIFLFGMPKEQLISKNIKQFIPEREKEYFAIKMQKLLDGVNSEISAGHLDLPDGTTKDVEVKAVAVNVDQRKLFFSLINDTTEKNKAIEQNIFNDKLATIGVLATSIIHEINNPLASMMVNLDLAVNNVRSLKEKGLNGKISETEDLILQLGVGARKIKNIVGNLKSFGRKDDNVGPVNIQNTIESAISIVQAQYKHTAQINLNLSNEMPSMILNGGKLEQVIINLLMNAFQAFSDPNAVDKNVITVSSCVQCDSIIVEIEDNGSGMPQSLMDHIFDPFFTTKPTGIGTGLGLSISMQIVKSMGGEIHVKSQVGKGTAFTIVLPIYLKVDDMINAAAIERGVSGKRILVVSNEVVSGEILRKVLGSKNELEIVISVRDAIHKIVSQINNQFDVLIVDLDMPDVSGIDFYNYLQRKSHPLSSRMIFLMDKDYEGICDPFFEQMKHAILKKPYSSDTLMQLLKTIIASKLQ